MFVPLDLSRNTIILAIGFGLAWRLARLGLNPTVDRIIEMLAQAGSPAALIALGINLFRFEAKGEKLDILVMCALKPLAISAAAFGLAKLLGLHRSRPASSCCSRRCRPAPTRITLRFSISGW
ncbi:AEC family transporter [Bradyrhizobium sp. McL0616]|uniref:AEC family transporter n=1 Tax=Bradyrhizobium sp. McL0616 TaxID=3415674 RepID=UPI003CF59F55